MGKVTVWTKQSSAVLENLEKYGRHLAEREYIGKSLEEYGYLVREVYDWLAKNTPNAITKPEGATYPVWVSFKRESTMLPTEGTVILELSVDEELITDINIDKWSTILNYSYIPLDDKDAKQHHTLLEQYGISDVDAYMTQFYPIIKRKIVNSWQRLFDNSVIIYSDSAYGNIWEVRKEWVTKVIR